MASKTTNYDLTKLDSDEGIHDGDGSFPSADRDTIDRVLYRNATHKHTGAASATSAPTTALTLSLSTSGGSIPPDTTVRYKYAYIDPDTGESLPGPEATVSTSSEITAPDAPTTSVSTTGGTLEPGEYYYVASQYQDSTTVETLAQNPVNVTIPVGTSTNQVDLTLQALDSGATGFNIYRRSPSSTKYFHIGDTTSTSFTDDGLADDCDRSLPSSNSTNSTNSVDITNPETIPTDNDWVIYRTYTTSYTDSKLVQLTDDTNTYTDEGDGTSSGTPVTAVVAAQPDKIDLQDSAEVQGILPLGLISGFPQTVPFSFSQIEVVEGDFIYPIEFPTLELLAVRATVSTAPTGSDIEVDVKYHDGNSWTSIFGAATPTLPTISVGSNDSGRFTPTTSSVVEGNWLRADITQKDSDDAAVGLLINIYAAATYTTTTSSDFEV